MLQPFPDEFTGRNYTKIIVYSAVGVGGCLLITLILGFALHYLNISGWLESFFSAVASMGPWGYILMGMVMAILNLPFTFAYLPTASLCGFMYSFWWGMLVVSMGSGVGMLCVFLMFRYWMRKSAAKFIEQKGGYMGRAMMYELKQSSRAEHIKLVILIRIAAPFPPGLQNAVLAVSGIPIWLYQLVSMLSMLVKQVPAVYIGSTVKDISELTSSGSDWELKDYLLVVIGFVGILIICIVVFYFTKKTIARAKQLREEDKIKENESIISDDLEDSVFPARPELIFASDPDVKKERPKTYDAASLAETKVQASDQKRPRSTFASDGGHDGVYYPDDYTPTQGEPLETFEVSHGDVVLEPPERDSPATGSSAPPESESVDDGVL